jgi:hypothetical protein
MQRISENEKVILEAASKDLLENDFFRSVYLGCNLWRRCLGCGRRRIE